MLENERDRNRERERERESVCKKEERESKWPYLLIAPAMALILRVPVLPPLLALKGKFNL